MSRNRIPLTVLLAAVIAALLLIAPASATAQVRVGVYGGWYGPYPYGYWGPYYAPYGWGPYWGPYGPYYDGYYGYYGRNPLGEVRIKSPDKKALIYINGAYAGTAGDLKRFYLKPGTYTIEQRIGSDVQKLRIYVVTDRTVKIRFDKPGEGSYEAKPPPQK